MLYSLSCPSPALAAAAGSCGALPWCFGVRWDALREIPRGRGGGVVGYPGGSPPRPGVTLPSDKRPVTSPSWDSPWAPPARALGRRGGARPQSPSSWRRADPREPFQEKCEASCLLLAVQRLRGVRKCTGEAEERAAQLLHADASVHVRAYRKSGCFGADVTLPLTGRREARLPAFRSRGLAVTRIPRPPRARAGTARHAGQVAVGQPLGFAAQPPCLRSLLSASPVSVLHGAALLPDPIPLGILHPLIFRDLGASCVPCPPWRCGTPVTGGTSPGRCSDTVLRAVRRDVLGEAGGLWA